MLLAIDIGNMTLTLGGFEGEALRFTVRLGADVNKTVDEYAMAIHGVLQLRGVKREEITGAILSSVVPPLTSVIKGTIRFLFGLTPLVVGPGIKTGLVLHCDDPASVGGDLVAACVAANVFYGAPSLVIDMGLATNLCVLNEKGVFAGAVIMPGVGMGMDALAKETAQLPYVSLEAPRGVIGKNTADCMRAGVIYGNACMADGMIDRIRGEMKNEMRVIVTGEFAPLIAPHLTHEVTADETLVLKGLAFLYRKNQ